MQKTLKQIADELGIDKQQVYRFVQKNRINEARTDVKTKYYDEAAQNVIKMHFLNYKSTSRSTSQSNHETTIDALLLQLEQKDKEINKLHELLDQQQKLSLIDKQKIFELEQKGTKEEQKETNRFFSRFFGKY